MQGQRSANAPLPELSFLHSFASSESSMNPQSCWNRMLNPSQGQPSDCVASSSNGNTAYLNSVGQEGHALSGWNYGGSSSSGACDLSHQNNLMNDCARAALVLGDRQYEFSGNLSLNSLNGNLHSEQDVSRSWLMQSSSVPSDLITNLESAVSNDDENSDDDCQVIECVDAFRFGSNEQLVGTSRYSHNFSGTPSENGVYSEGADGRPNSSLGGRHLSCKRKTREPSFGQSSGSGSSNYVENVGNSLCQGTTICNNAASSIPVAPGGQIDINSEGSPPRLGLSLGEPASEFPLSLSTSEHDERSHRNFRLRINTSQQQDGEPVAFSCTQSAGGNFNASSAERSLILPPYSLDMGPSYVAEDGNPQRPMISSLRRNSQSRCTKASISRAANPSSALSGEGVPSQSAFSLHPSSQTRWTRSSISRAANPSSAGEGVPSESVSSLHQSLQSRWSRSSISRAGNPSSPISGEGVYFHTEESDLRNVPGVISQHPMFMPASEIGSSSQNPGNWNLAAKNVGVHGNVASTSHGGLGSGFNSPAPSLVPHYHYPSRLPEYAPRSLITPLSIGTGNQNTTPNLIHSGAHSLPEIAFPSTSANQGNRFHTRSSNMLERQLGSNVGIPYPSRGLAAASEGRIRLVSEIRNVLDRMRRGEALRVEDLMILDQSGFFGMAELHDRHRDMRLDVDNMSYEELLALEERIGNVCTGLSEETISSKLKRRKYVHVNTELEEEPCCICQDEYNDGQDLGIIECGHEFHTGCIKQWLMQKNMCPICKTTGLNK